MNLLQLAVKSKDSPFHSTAFTVFVVVLVVVIAAASIIRKLRK